MVIDVQPGYRRSISTNLMCALVEEINARCAAGLCVYLVYNDEELSGDVFEDIQQFWATHGLDEEVMAQCHFVEKQYAELRGWMDNGIDEEDIVQTLRAMRAQQVWDSRMLDEMQLQALSEAGAHLADPLFRSAFLEQSDLARLQAVDICGGGRNECLREVELWLQSRDIRYERMEHLVY